MLRQFKINLKYINYMPYNFQEVTSQSDVFRQFFIKTQETFPILFYRMKNSSIVHEYSDNSHVNMA